VTFLIQEILETAISASSGGNRQPWAGIVIRAAETHQAIADY
jgi:nitroreductase